MLPRLDNASNRTSSTAAKRKLDELSTVMNKQQCTATSLACRRSPPAGVTTGGVQFFVRMIGGAGHRTITIRGMDPSDTIASIHGRIKAVTGIPCDQQRLIYQGRQLNLEKSLAECNITRDATLEMTSRLPSFRHSRAWQWVGDIVSGCLTLCRGGEFPSKTLNEYVSGFFQVDAVEAERRRRSSREKEEEEEEEEEDIKFSTFLALSAPAALVMLYLSPTKANKEIADECIRDFIQNVKAYKLDDLAKPFYHKFAPIVLEFCKLLRPHVANDDPIYDCLRSCFGCIVKSLEIRPSKLNAIGIGVHDVFPFVKELAAKLCNDLTHMPECIMSSGPAESQVRDFFAFAQHCGMLFKNVDDCKGGSGPFVDEIRFLCSTYYDLMMEVELCLRRLEEHLVTGKEKGWRRFLTILRELNGLSKMFKGGVAEEIFWIKIKPRKAALSNLVVRFAERGENYEWISQRKQVLDFAARRHLALLLLPEMSDEYVLYEMLIDRSHLLAESFEYIANVDASLLLSRLFIKFKDEEATGPGVLREWFLLVCQEIFNPQNALFVACPNDRRRFLPNPASKVNPMHLDYFKFAGRIIALALIHKIQVGVVFDRVFTLRLAGKDISLEDIQDADPYLYSSCKQILAMDPDVVDQDAPG